MTSIRKEERRMSLKNFGMAFVVFKDVADANKCLQKRWLKDRMLEKLSVEQLKKIGFSSWKVDKAYL